MQQTATMTLPAWEPCLAQQDRTVFRQLIHITNKVVQQKLDTRMHNETFSPGIMSGDAGAVLYLFHSAIYQEDDRLYDKALDYLEKLVADISASHAPSLCSGMVGVIWLLLYLDSHDMVQVTDDMISEEIMNYLCEESLQQINAGYYDYMHMGLGMPLALLASAKYTHRYADYLEKVVQAMAATAQKTADNCIYWRYMLDNDNSDDTPEEKVSLGMSHGMPGIIALLSKIRAAGICIHTCDELIEQAAGFLLKKCNDTGAVSCYPSMFSFGNNEPYINSRLGWCYGDMGVAAAFIQAGKATGRHAYLEEADRIISSLIRRGDDASRVTDGGFCHGSFGIAHIYNRLYQYKKTPALKELAARWFRRSLDMTRFTAGHIAILLVEDKKSSWNDHTDILSGISGIGITLLSAVAPVIPAWDEVFLLDIGH